MAKYEVTHTCGHTHTYQLYGKTADRERKMAWLAEQECPECRKAAEAEEAAKATEGIELPALTGSPKQIAWANTIRGKFVALLQSTEGVKMDNALIIISLYTSASWWIDNRAQFDSIYALKNMFADRKDEVLAIINGTAKQEEPAAEEKVKSAEKPAQEPEEAPEAPDAEEMPAPAPKAPQKTIWRKISVNLQNIECSTERAALINLPHKSKHDGFSVWVSKKLLRAGRHSYEYLLSVKDDMEFELKKYGKGRWNKSKVIEAKTISAEQLAEAFGGWVDDAPRYTRPAIDPDAETIEHHEPAPLAPVEIAADPELTR